MSGHIEIRKTKNATLLTRNAITIFSKIKAGCQITIWVSNNGQVWMT